MNETFSCRRCGECCRKGGPTLHRDDLRLLKGGPLRPADLYTLRVGETVYHNVRETLVRLDRELLKVREGPDGRACMFLDSDTTSCRIHDHRPLQCRALLCGDTRELEEVLSRPFLGRRDLLPEGVAFLDLLDAHDQRCSPAKLAELAARMEQHPEEPEAAREAADMVGYDAAFRSLMGERFGIHLEELDFFFGRPLSVLLRLAGIRPPAGDRETTP